MTGPRRPRASDDGVSATDATATDAPATETPGGAGSSGSGAAPKAADRFQIWKAQTSLELRLSLRHGESLLLTFGIPILLLVFFSLVDVLPTGTDDSIDFLFPGILALAVMSTAFVSTAISTGFEREAGVLKRLGSTPLSRGTLIAAKTASIVCTQAIQVVVFTGIAVLLGFRFSGSGEALALMAVALGTIAFTGLGMLMAGSLPALTTLAAANGVYLLLVLSSGMLFSTDELPGPMAAVSRVLPSRALADLLHGTLGVAELDQTAWLVLAVWAVAAPAAAARWFRWT